MKTTTAQKLHKPAQNEPENHLHESEPRWFAVYTRYKSEKMVHQLLSNKKIHSYVPLQKVTRRYVRKIKVHDIPLISCYVFVKIIKDEYVPVLETENVVKFIRFAKSLYAIPEDEIDILRRIVGEDGLEIHAEPGVFHEGDMVEIISGRLTGIKGRLVEKTGKKQMVIELENIGYSLRLNVDVSLLRKI